MKLSVETRTNLRFYHVAEMKCKFGMEETLDSGFCRVESERTLRNSNWNYALV